LGRDARPSTCRGGCRIDRIAVGLRCGSSGSRCWGYGAGGR
jgi:hypothetical protein